MQKNKSYILSLVFICIYNTNSIAMNLDEQEACYDKIIRLERYISKQDALRDNIMLYEMFGRDKIYAQKKHDDMVIKSNNYWNDYFKENDQRERRIRLQVAGMLTTVIIGSAGLVYFYKLKK